MSLVYCKCGEAMEWGGTSKHHTPENEHLSSNCRVEFLCRSCGGSKTLTISVSDVPISDIREYEDELKRWREKETQRYWESRPD